MSSRRVHELAGEIGVSSKEILSAAEKIGGIYLKTASSSIESEDAEKIRRFLTAPPEPEKPKPAEDQVKTIESAVGKVVETRKKTGAVVRRRRKPAAETPQETPEAAPPAPSSPKPPAADEPAQESVQKKPPAAPPKPQKPKEPKEVDPEKEILARRMKDALVSDLSKKSDEPPSRPPSAPRKKEYVVDDEKSLRRRQDNIRRQRQQRPQQGASSPPSAPAPPPGKKSVKIGETITLDDLARRMEIRIGDVRAKARSVGVDPRSAAALDYETATLIAAEYGLDVEVDRFDESDYLNDRAAGLKDEDSRPPVVSVMGHVDHGKTTLLDTLRNANVASGEAGGITQHIGAYRVASGDRRIVFIDTPGHEAFTSMRARGASINDIVILVVAADEGVREQTIEAVSHAKAAGVPVIVAVNKIDKEGADPENARRQLSEHGLVSEEWGGDTMFANISAKSGAGIKELLELIILQSDVLELKAPGSGLAKGVVLESRLDKGRGAIADVIVTQGRLSVGDQIVAGLFCGKIRALTDDAGAKVKTAGPSTPVEVMGLPGVPEAGEMFHVVKDEKTARQIVENRRIVLGRQDAPSVPQPLSMDSLKTMPSPEEQEAGPKEFSLILKSDTQGSAEAVRDSIKKLDTEKCSVKIAHSAVGGISGADVELAYVTGSIILGFNVRPDSKAAADASERGVVIETYPVVYELVDRVKLAMEGLLDPLVEEETRGHARVKEVFRISGQRIVAGCVVDDGKVLRGQNVRIVRNGAVVYESTVGSLRRFKDDVREVQSGYECGMTIENFSDVKVGDVFEVFRLNETAQQL